MTIEYQPQGSRSLERSMVRSRTRCKAVTDHRFQTVQLMVVVVVVMMMMMMMPIRKQ